MPDNHIKLEVERIGKTGKARITMRFPDGSSHTDKVDLADATGRARFIRGACKGRKLDRAMIEAELQRSAADLVAKPRDDGGSERGGGKEEKESQADRIVALVVELGVELFHTPGGADSHSYASIKVGEHVETWPIRSKGFRSWIGKVYYDEFGKVPGTQAMQDAVNVLVGTAIHDGPEHSVSVRVAEHDGAIYLDLCNPDWQVVRIDASGWQVVNDVPIKFARRRGMRAIPVPEKGGRLNDLREFVNLPDRNSWIMFIAWLVAAIRPGRPCPVLAVNGEQGSAKSTLSRVARALVDPNDVPLRRPPKDARDLMIAATNAWIVAYDNLSKLSTDLSDCLCCLSTGGGFGTRELYSDDEERLFGALRPVIVNGIDDVVARADLLDRALTVTLPTISDDQRRDEESFWARFEAARPRILGALLDAVSTAIRNVETVKLANKPRMADFATWIVAAEPALVWKRGDFLRAYSRNRAMSDSVVMEASPIALLIVQLLASTRNWEGTPKQLLIELESIRNDVKCTRLWPNSPRHLADELRRIAPTLRKRGVDVLFDGHCRDGTKLTITCKRGHTGDDYDDAQIQASRPKSRCEVRDDCDGVLRTCSNGLESRKDHKNTKPSRNGHA